MRVTDPYHLHFPCSHCRDFWARAEDMWMWVNVHFHFPSFHWRIRWSRAEDAETLKLLLKLNGSYEGVNWSALLPSWVIATQVLSGEANNRALVALPIFVRREKSDIQSRPPDWTIAQLIITPNIITPKIFLFLFKSSFNGLY